MLLGKNDPTLLGIGKLMSHQPELNGSSIGPILAVSFLTRLKAFFKMRTYFAKQIQEFQRQAPRVYQNPSKKNVHQLRVTVRKIRAALWLLDQGSQNVSLGKLSRDLRKLGHSLGHQREIDVAIEDATARGLKTAKLETRRRREMKNLRRDLNFERRDRIARRLKKVLSKISHRQKLDLKIGLLKLRNKLKPWEQRSVLRNRDLHQLRIMVKKVRYALEAIGKPVAPLKELQTLLGRGHDLEILQEFLGKNSELQSEMAVEYKKAKNKIQPAIRFVLKQL